MLIKVINFAHRAKRRPSDLRRLFRYLFTPKLSAEPDLNRLLGPPLLDQLVLTHGIHSDEEIALASDDLANQIDFYTREAGVCQHMKSCESGCGSLKKCKGQKRPADWYAHIIFSFAPFAATDLRTPSDPHKSPRKHASSAANAIRIARDTLDFLGWIDLQPGVFVAHGDREHIHVHTVIATTVFDDKAWNPFKFPRQFLFEVAMRTTEAFGLSTETPMLHQYYAHWEGVNNTADTE